MRTTVLLCLGKTKVSPLSRQSVATVSDTCAMLLLVSKTESKKRVLLTSEYRERLTARAVPGATWDAEAKAWVMEDPTPRSAAVALRAFPRLLMTHPWLAELRDSVKQSVRPFDNATPFGVEIKAPRVRASLTTESKDLFHFQGIDLGYIAAILEAHGGAYIGWERGLGKTIAACALMDELDARLTLIVAPNTAKESVWRDELSRRLPDTEVWVLPNAKSKRERMIEALRARNNDSGPLALVVHYEALALIAGTQRMLKQAAKDDWEPYPAGHKRQDGDQTKTILGDGWKKLGPFDLMVVDEGHRLKNPKSQMSKAAKKVPAVHRVVLSGSIVENHLEEMFSPLQFLFPQSYRSKWRDWNDRYLDYVEGAHGRLCVGVRQDKIEEMRAELGVFMVYRRKEDELDLPGKTEQTLLVELSPAQRRAYDELRDTYLTQLDNSTVVKATEGLALLTRLRQVATGLDLVDESLSDSAKVDTAAEMILDDEDSACVVFSWFKGACRAMAEKLRASGVEPFIITGDTKQATRTELIARFQAGEGRVMIGTLSTMGESVNLQRASSAIFLDRAWNPALNAQAMDRIFRIGQTRPVTITHLVAKDTVDELRVQPALAEKEALRAAILGGY